MTTSAQSLCLDSEALVAAFFRASEGQWRSERRYYTLKNDEIQEGVSFLTVRFLEADSEELIQLAQAHGLPEDTTLVCGAETTWETHSSVDMLQMPSKGSSIFGVLGSTLYRDRGFATPKPVKAAFYFSDPKTMRLRTEYNSSSFEEEIKLIGSNHRTRQTIISRAGQEIMIGQYLEGRLV